MSARRDTLPALGHLAVIAVAAFALAQMFGPDIGPMPLNLALWLLGGALLHDLVLLPAYVLADRGLQRLLPAGAINHVRAPVAIAGVLLLVWFPRILDRQPQNFERALGHPAPNFLGRWLVVCAILFGGSAALYAARHVRAGRPAAPRRSAP